MTKIERIIVRSDNETPLDVEGVMQKRRERRKRFAQYPWLYNHKKFRKMMEETRGLEAELMKSLYGELAEKERQMNEEEQREAEKRMEEQMARMDRAIYRCFITDILLWIAMGLCMVTLLAVVFRGG